jgi:hypothetical protein
VQQRPDDDCDGVPDDGFPRRQRLLRGHHLSVPGTLQARPDRLALRCVPGAPVAPRPCATGSTATATRARRRLRARPCVAGAGTCRRDGTIVCNGRRTADMRAVAATGTAEGATPSWTATACSTTASTSAGRTVGLAPASAWHPRVRRRQPPRCAAPHGAPTAERCGNAIDENATGRRRRLRHRRRLHRGHRRVPAHRQRSATRRTPSPRCQRRRRAANPLGECGNLLDDDCDTSVDRASATSA